MNKYICKFFVGVCATIAISACSSDFLETTPTSSIATSTVFKTTQNVKMAVNGLALLMKSQHSAFSQGYCGENRIRSVYYEYTSQEFRYNSFASGWAQIMNGEYYTQKTTTYTKYPWAYYYEIITNANTIIANVAAATGEESDKQFLKAQALTFRAYCYAKLLELYTPRWQDTKDGSINGIILRLDESTGSKPLSTVLECYTQVYKDLDDAISNFKSSGKDRNTSEYWLTNLNVAYAIYARTALNRQDYNTALSMAKNARKGYPLMSNAEYGTGFSKQTSEWLFGSYDGDTENNWYWTFGTQFACNGYYTQATEYGAGAIEKEFTDRMPTDDVRMKCFLTADKFGDLDLYAGKGTTKSKDGTITTGVPHMNKTYGYMSSDEARQIAATYINSRTPSGLAKAYQSGYYHLGAQLKFWAIGTPGIEPLCFIRSSEMVLIEAEANYFLKNEKEAQASLVELNATSGRNPKYTCTKTGDALFQEIVDYRELELWGEGFNWYDIKRWNKNITRLGFNKGGNCHLATATTISANSSNWTWSLPETETDYNTEIK